MNGYCIVVEGHDPDDVCKKQLQIFENDSSACVLVCMVHINSHDKMKAVTWLDCCCFACKQTNVVGIEQMADCCIVK